MSAKCCPNSPDGCHNYSLVTERAECDHCRFEAVIGVAKCSHCGKEIGPTPIEYALNFVAKMTDEDVNNMLDLQALDTYAARRKDGG